MKYAGWIVVVLVPVVVWTAMQYVPYPGSLLVSIAAIGALVGSIVYEHARHRRGISQRTIIEQILIGVLLLAVLATVV